MAEDKVVTNEVNQVGILPSQDMDGIRVYSRIPENAEQVVGSYILEGDTLLEYTVTAGKTLYLSTMTISVRNISEVVGSVNWIIVDEVAEGWYYFFVGLIGVDLESHLHALFNPPMQIPGNYSFQLYSSEIGVKGYAAFFGYEM